MNRRLTDSLIVGFALFAVFFGAGNLIFPPSIGFQTGTSWGSAILGLTATGIILPILAVIAVGNSGGTFEELTKPISPWFYKVYNSIIMLGVGLFITIPRTAATAYEMGVRSMFPQIPSFIVILVYFGLTYYFANDKSNVIDKVGKILTPALILILTLIVFKGFINPIGVPKNTGLSKPFSNAFIQGYQTGDLLTGLLCASIFISAIHGKGYKDEKSSMEMLINASIVSFIGLFIIYSGLLFIGATGNSFFNKDVQMTTLLIELVRKLLGNVGVAGLSISVVLASLTTAIGLIASAGDFLSNLTKNKLSYRNSVLLYCVVGVGVALMGVEKIVAFAGPVFLAIYPLSIVLVALGLFRKYIPNDGAYKGAAIFTVIVSLLDTAHVMGVKSSLIESIITRIPFSSSGFTWILPSIIGFIAGAMFLKGNKEVKGL